MRRLAPGDRLVLATHNQGKLREIQFLLQDTGIEVLSAAALNLPEPEETAPDFAGNSRLKALAAAQAANLPALADDSGFCVAALNGRPGVLSARWAGPAKNFPAAFARIRSELGENPDHRAWFTCTLCQAWPDGETHLFEGRVEGTLTFPPRGANGFGYDPIFTPAGSSFTYGELPPATKHQTSHRARALAVWREAVVGSE